VLVEDYRGYYNNGRHHSALGYQASAEFVAAADLGGKVENAGGKDRGARISTHTLIAPGTENGVRSRAVVHQAALGSFGFFVGTSLAP
jgi:hypothetical protein